MSRTARERPCWRGGLRSDWHGVVSDALGSGLAGRSRRVVEVGRWPLDGGAEAQRTYSPSWIASGGGPRTRLTDTSATRAREGSGA